MTRHARAEIEAQIVSARKYKAVASLALDKPNLTNEEWAACCEALKDAHATLAKAERRLANLDAFERDVARRGES